MDSENPNQNLELLNVAIKKPVEERKNNETSIDDDDKLLLSRLLSQVESLKQEQGAIEKKRTDEIAEEIKKVKRQNVVTHWLLSALVVVTLAWQISEVSLILRLKEGLNDGLNHPFKYIGGMFMGMLKRPRPSPENANDNDEPGNPNNNGISDMIPQIPPLKVPDLPNVELPDLIHESR